MKKTKRILAFMLAAVLICAAVPAGCMFRMDASVYAKGFLNCIAAKDYKGAYERTYPYSAQRLKEEDIIAKYKNIFEALKIKSVTFEAGETAETETGYTYTYQAKYVSETYGDFINTYTMQLYPYEDTLRVDWHPSLIFPVMDFGDTVSIQTLKAKRGEIFSADGEALAKNDYADTVVVNLTKSGEFAAFGPALLEKLQKYNIKQEDLQKKYDTAVKNKQDILVVKSFPKGTFDEAAVADLKKIPGVDVDTKKYSPLRYYTLKDAASHIVGYTGTPDEKEAKAFKDAGVDPTTLIGRTGLELAYDEKMRGIDGEAVYIKDEFGGIKATLFKKEAQNGCDLRLSMNSALQLKAYNLLAENLVYGQSGAAIVLDANTGYVEAAVSWPSFDSNIFSFPIPDDVYKAFNAAGGGKPLFSKLTQGRYPPGSVIKPFTASAALETGAITPSMAFPEEDRIKDNKWTPSGEDWGDYPIKRVEDSGSPLKLRNALVESDNIYFAWAAMQVGQEKILEYFKKYSLGENMPFDLPLAESQILNESSTFTRKMLADTGYGQGELLVTPMQMAAMYTVFASGGDMKQPAVVTALKRENGTGYDTVEEIQPKVYKSGVVNKSTLDILLPLMEEVVESGTGRGARVSGVRIAGKTGTAEIGEDKSREISWFAGFWMENKNAAAENEKRLVLVMVDVPEGQGKVKFDIAKELLKP